MFTTPRRALGRAALAAATLATAVGAGTHRHSVSLERGPVPVVVVDHADDADQRARLLRVVEVALPLIEREAGFALPEEEVRLEVYSRRGPETAGEVGYFDHQARALRVEAGITDALLVHELAHLWFADRFAADFAGRGRWLIEGLAHWTTYRVALHAPALVDPATFHRALVETFWVPGDPARDPPLGWVPPVPVPMPRPPELEARMFAWYAKVYALFHAFEARAGEGAVRRLNQQSWHRGGQVEADAYLASMAFASGTPAAVWRRWLEGGAPDVEGRTLVEDRDQDGLSLGEERLFALDPARADTDADGWSDGVEVRVTGTDPTSPRSGPAPGTPRADGSFADWPRGHRRLVGAPGTVRAGEPAAADLRDLRVHVDQHFLYLGLETAGGFDREGYVWNVGLDLDGDDGFDRIVGLAADHRPYKGRVFRDWRKTDWQHQTLAPFAMVGNWLEVGNRLELFVPLSVLEASGPARVFAYTNGPSGRADGLGWVEVVLPEVP